MADDPRASIDKLTEVTLMRPSTMHGVTMAAGMRGVVMAAYADGLANEVEFAESHLVLTIEGADLSGGASCPMPTPFASMRPS